MSKELTEQWKNGTLPCGSYYLKLISGATRADFFEGLKFCYFNSEDIEEVLAPVPTYEQFVDLTKKVYELEKKLSYAMEALNFYAQPGLLEGNCARDVLEKIERVGKNHDLSNNH